MQLTKHLVALLAVGRTTENNNQCPSHHNKASPTVTTLPSSINNLDRRQAWSVQIGIITSALTSTVMTSPASATIMPTSATSPKTTTSLSTSQTVNFARKQPGLVVGDLSKDIVCEVFVDFACPYSRKMFEVLSELVKTDKKYTKRMAFMFHNVVQPWHHQSLWLHESSFAVKLLYPDVEYAYWTALFKDAPNWYDKEIYDLTRSEFYDKIASFAANIIVAETSNKTSDNNNNKDYAVIKSRILQYLIPPLQKGGDFPSGGLLLGASPTDDENALFPMSKQVVKFQRNRGVHVTPTVFFNGIEQTQISSKWGPQEWSQFLNEALLYNLLI